MTTLEQLTQTVRGLPDQVQREVLHYALYLADRAVGEESIPPETAVVRRRALSEALEAAARINPFEEVSDPVAWQRDNREDRALPGRDQPAC
jgi:hypothetical protein